MKNNLSRETAIIILMVFSSIFCSEAMAQAEDQLNVAIVSLSHDHAYGIMNAYRRNEVQISGIVETNKDLISRYQQNYDLPDSLFFETTESLLEHIKPDVVLAYNPISEHVDVARVVLPLKIPLMVEKPLATTNEQAMEMARLARENDTWLLTNYETTWYPSNQTLMEKVLSVDFGNVKKMIAKHGHQGPKEIGVSSEFLTWLTDPEMNGGGALMDFGCYGANLFTWLQGGKRPIAVTAVTRNFKPGIYPKVDDDATIILEYENATGIIQASWDWSYSIKSLQVYGIDKSYHAPNGSKLLKQTSPKKVQEIKLIEYYQNHLTYLKDVLKGKINPENDLSSLSNNLIVVEILEAARKSAKSGKRVKMWMHVTDANLHVMTPDLQVPTELVFENIIHSSGSTFF